MLLRLLAGIPRDRRWLVFLTAVNLAGFAYGMNWYRSQLAVVSPWAWPVTADCPVSALLFGTVTALLAAGRKPGALQGVAFVAALKYGLWTVLVISQSLLAGATLDADAFNLLWTHAGMAAEALLFGAVLPLRPGWVALGAAWTGLNTLLDYGAGLHPTLPAQTPLNLALGASLGLGAVSVGVFGALALRGRRGRAYGAGGAARWCGGESWE